MAAGKGRGHNAYGKHDAGDRFGQVIKSVRRSAELILQQNHSRIPICWQNAFGSGGEMTEVLLDVPLIAQTKSRSCWHACIRMVKEYAGIVTTKGLQRTARLQHAWNTNVGVTDYTGLAKAEGFKLLSHNRPLYTVESLSNTLQEYGPLWTNTTDGTSYQHAVVITGVSNEMDAEEVYFNDPWPIDSGTSSIKTLKDFNNMVSMAQQMYYPPNIRGAKR
jgi:uncharacterized protein YvpB